MKLILDLDTGIDDALALAYGLGHEKAEIIGITTVYGNVNVENSTSNTQKILKLLDSSEIPVIKGAKNARLDSSYEQKRGGAIFHGKNGLANVNLDDKMSSNLLDKKAEDFLIESANKLREDLTIVATGPLTNIALAIEKNPEAMSNLKEIIIMGGAFTVPGNVSPVAEANISQDVEAANILFKSEIPVTVIGLDVTMRTLLNRKDIEDWKLISEIGKKYKEITDFYLDAHDKISPDLGGCALHDPLAVAVALNPDLVKTQNFNVRVINTGEQKGRIISDLERLNNREKKNIKIALDIDHDTFKEDFLKNVHNAFNI